VGGMEERAVGHLIVVSCSISRMRRVLCVGAHSDDIEIGCGGTVLELIRQNPEREFYWAVFSGDRERRTEARASARAFLKGAVVRKIRTAGFRISYFPVRWEKIKDLFEQIRAEFNPDLVLTHYRQDRHQDHRVLSDLAWNTFRDHVVLEYEIPKYDGDLGTPNVYMPLSQEICQKKVQYLCRFFQTQGNKHWFSEDTFLSLMRIRGIECASTTKYAEAFYGRKITMD
jgi:LmbE family N-acetylglucosaminyl deacetylase